MQGFIDTSYVTSSTSDPESATTGGVNSQQQWTVQTRARSAKRQMLANQVHIRVMNGKEIDLVSALLASDFHQSMHAHKTVNRQLSSATATRPGSVQKKESKQRHTTYRQQTEQMEHQQTKLQPAQRKNRFLPNKQQEAAGAINLCSKEIGYFTTRLDVPPVRRSTEPDLLPTALYNFTADFAHLHSYNLIAAVQLQPQAAALRATALCVDEITNDSTRQIGHAFFNSRVLMLKNDSMSSPALSFSTTFVLDIITYNGSGGHGMAFVIARSIPLHGVQDGQYLGLLNENNNGNFSNNLFAIEFDTVNATRRFVDFKENHVGVDINNLSSVVADQMFLLMAYCSSRWLLVGGQ
ncbi:hypothetical protein ZIOFF_068521 [Zingiber officinale]|uniref:Legume lectin domain-containing protein n=1 Tax=Zingiber officinale TaxID=94328 RepID=A0A8J5BLW9_ZINOF|nr:hypothetical protein ZIOFF_068521 [Zingiber officinale]